MTNNNICSLKKELRAKAKSVRKELDMDGLSSLVCENFKKSDFYKKANEIFVYHSYKDEVSTISLFDDSSKKWSIPYTKGGEMWASRYEEDLLVENKLGIKEISGFAKITDNDIEIIVLPALMVDKNGIRLGYGKGYYDKFLSRLNNPVLKVVFVPEALFVDEIPSELHDEPCDIVVTEKQVYYCKK